eukprot:CAMPEP_0181052714 /NCGR_PEP_ID=MMETSP1070-20121207/17735_1 /TAXON_ID=265543 /ORGANISM="Minutocellus polymorphus, Strain NH13" /LENGTH=346 /DNA_ID=CAMNT_0023131821 /DNA_START=19 /DNA_END=1059 /DNA_ORIENTATION=-
MASNRRRQRSEMGASCKTSSVSLLVLILVQSSECFVHNLAQQHRASNNSKIRTNSQPQCVFMIKETDKFGSIDEYDDDDGSLSPADMLGPEVITDPEDGDDEYGDTEEDWVPDIEIAKRISDRKLARAEDLIGQAEDSVEIHSPSNKSSAGSTPSSPSSSLATDEDGTIEVEVDDYFAGPNTNTPSLLQKSKRQIYTDEEEDLINSMGGNSIDNPSPKREAGFLGDSTLREISRDFQVPIYYLADVLCTWGVPVPINVDERLGDMVTGEMAFAVAEAVHSMDVGEIYDSYSSFDLAGLCFEYDVELKDAFDFVIKEGWNLPFGVKTHLRIDQEDKLLRTLSDDLVY